jgi:predicted nuclease of restriction endonuclease-like (RecB) superfamily
VNRSLKGYTNLYSSVRNLLTEARRHTARSVNAILTATYWEIGRRIVEFEQRGARRAGYGEELLVRLSKDLSEQFGRGFSRQNLDLFRRFYLVYQGVKKCQALPSIFTQKSEALPRKSSNHLISKSIFGLVALSQEFQLSWTHYVLLVRRIRSNEARQFYEEEALRCGWSTRQLLRQIESQFYECTALSRNKAKMLKSGEKPQPSDQITPEQELKDPYILEFLGLRDEYTEGDLEEALIHHLETFLMELGGDFTFIGRQKRLRIGSEWYRVDLVLYHRRLHCLVLIDLKLGRLTHADAGQMHMYLNYAREHWTLDDENPPVGIILCAHKDNAVVRYALDGLPNKVLASEYKTILPSEQIIAEEIEQTKKLLEERKRIWS